MRLTLRTLLAYLDDILEPSQTKEIGSKLVESKFASDLVDRIREVMRRRRLSAPLYDGKDGGLDANLMAEYLDNTLSPEKVTDVERQCLESDMHLAEAAACHQILTLVLGEPVDIASETRRRMYGLVSQASGDDQAAVAANQVPADELDPEEADDLATMLQSKEQTETIDSALPDYLKPKPLWMRAAAVAVPIALIAVFVISVLTDPAYSTRVSNWFGMGAHGTPIVASSEPGSGPLMAKISPEKAGHAAQSTKTDADQAAATPKSATATSATIPPAVTKSANASHAKTVPQTKLPAEGSPLPVVAPLPVADKKPELAGSPPSPPAPGDTTPAKPANDIEPSGAKKPPLQVATLPVRPGSATPPPKPTPVSVIPAKTSAAASTPPTASTPAAEPPPNVRLATNTGILLGYDAGRDDWFVVQRPDLKLPNPADAPGESVNKNAANNVIVPTPPAPMPMDRRADQLAAPEPFDSMLEFGDGLCRVWLIGGTSVRLLAPTGAARFGIELREGRIVIQSGAAKPSGAPYRPLVIAVAVRDELWQLALLKPETQCGLEILPAFPTRPSEDIKEIGYRGALYVLSGDVRFTEAVGRQRTLTSGRWISLTPSDRAVATDMGGSAFRPKGTASLQWLKPELRRVSTTQAKVAREFETDFLPDQPVSSSIGTVAKSDRNPKIAEYAAKTLGLTNQYQALVEVLAQVDSEEAVQAAANALRAWLPLAPDHAALLQRELSTTFQPADQDIVLRLLWGYNSDDAHSPETSRQLVDWLDNDKIAVRVMALDQILALTGRTESKRPGQHKSVKKEWERYLERNKGVLKR